jgi:biopolymer transport protein ExbB
MSFNLVHIWTTMSPLSKGIFVVLLIMAVLSIGVTVERWIAFRKLMNESKRFVEKSAPLFDEWRIDEVEELAKAYPGSALARLFAATIQRYIRGYESLDSGLSPVELRRGMSVVATVGSIAPFVGLLGTVVGIIAAFQGIGASGSGGIGAVSAGIAEALVETAFGLMVAIPAVIMFNWLTSRVAIIELTLARSSGELLDEMEAHRGGRSENRVRAAAE